MEELGGLLLPIAFLAVLYLLLIRPQQKRRKEQERMVRTLSVGDDIVTIGGLHGRVVALSEASMDITVDADEDIVLRYERASLARIVNEPVVVDEDELEELDLPDDDAVDDEAGGGATDDRPADGT